MTSLLACLLALVPADQAAVVDPAGVLRWANDGRADAGRDVALFGVNYYPAHWYDYLNLGRVHADRRKVAEQDIRHLQRLGLDLIRIHVFDRELSTADGDLIENDHLAVLDHVLAEARRRGMHAVLTPIAWWGTPNPSPGFSTLYTIEQMTTDAGKPRAAQRRYLGQFMRHRNPETGLTFGEDPAILAFELINEPIYPPGTTDAQVTEYVNSLVDAVREAGCRKPLFYNTWGNRGAALAKSKIDGSTQNWYPTGLASGEAIRSNTLHLVERYEAFAQSSPPGKPRGIYEFDAADVNGSVMYPAMARSFRAAGVQFASQFQYDCWPLASTNCDWQTHYLSLPYAPGKALSFMIAGATFHDLPLGRQIGSRDQFGATRVSYEQDLSELIDATRFYHSNATTTRPATPATLTHLAGVGSSPLVRYAGTGAWFLDRQPDGSWRLEVYPDVAPVDDPYGPTNLDREATRLVWAQRELSVDLPSLKGRFTVSPGVYRLASGAKPEPLADEFFAPPASTDPRPAGWHQPPDELDAGVATVIRSTAAPETAQAALVCRDGAGWRRLPMTRRGLFGVEATVPAELLRPGWFEYAIELTDGDHRAVLPGRVAAAPDKLPVAQPHTWFDAATAPRAELKPDGSAKGPLTAVQTAEAVSLASPGFDGTQATGLRLPVAPCPAFPAGAPLAVQVRARATQPATSSFELGLVVAGQQAFGHEISLAGEWHTTTLPLSEFHGLWGTPGTLTRPQDITALSLVYGAWLYGNQAGKPQGFEVASVKLVPQPPLWRVAVTSADSAVHLLRPTALAAHGRMGRGGGILLSETPDGAPAAEFTHPGFDVPPDSTGIQVTLDLAPRRQALLARCTKLRLRARALTPAATRIEVVVTERDGTPWGTELDLTPEWSTVDVPLTKLRLFKHWVVPVGRGGPDDRLHVEAIAGCNLTFGSWLNPAHAAAPWRFAIAELSLMP